VDGKTPTQLGPLERANLFLGSALPLLGSDLQRRTYPSSGFPNCSRPHLPDSNSNSSEQLNLNSSLTANSQPKLCCDRRSIGQSALVSRPHLESKVRFLLQSDSWGIVDVGRSVWWDDGSVVYNCCWSSPKQSFSGPSPAGLMTIFYCLIFEIPPTWRARFSYLYIPGTGWPSYIPRHWVPFSSPPTTCSAMVELL
jgi:hypothetical protein